MKNVDCGYECRAYSTFYTNLTSLSNAATFVSYRQGLLFAIVLDLFTKSKLYLNTGYSLYNRSVLIVQGSTLELGYNTIQGTSKIVTLYQRHITRGKPTKYGFVKKKSLFTYKYCIL